MASSPAHTLGSDKRHCLTSSCGVVQVVAHRSGAAAEIERQIAVQEAIGEDDEGVVAPEVASQTVVEATAEAASKRLAVVLRKVKARCKASLPS
jgi:hypothetical protein